MPSVFTDFGEKLSVCVEASRELMGIPFIKKFLVVLIPFHRLIVVEGVTAAYADILKTGITSEIL